MFTFKTKVRYSELSSDGIVRPEAIVNFLQDCTTFHSESLGASVAFYESENKAWVLNAWQIEIKGELKLGDEITVGTWPYEFAGAFGLRNFVIQDKDGNNVVEANTLWVFADIVTGRPIKLTEDYTKYYTLEEKLDMDYADRKIKVPEGVFSEIQKPVKIRKAFIDTNKHVNNSRYIECAAEFIPDNGKVKRIRAEYKKQARIDDVFYPMVYNALDASGNGILCVSLNDENSKPYAVVEFDIYA